MKIRLIFLQTVFLSMMTTHFSVANELTLKTQDWNIIAQEEKVQSVTRKEKTGNKIINISDWESVGDQGASDQNISLLESLFFITTFISVSLWEVVMFQRNTTPYPYVQGFAFFSLIQRFAIGVGMISIFGVIYGAIILVLCLTILQYLCHFTLGLIWSEAIKINYLIPTVLFSTNVWVLFVLSVLVFFN